MSIQYLFCTRLGSCTSSVSFVYPFAFTFLVRFLLSGTVTFDVMFHYLLQASDECRTQDVEVGTSEIPEEDHHTAADNPGVVMNEIEPCVNERRPSSDTSGIYKFISASNLILVVHHKADQCITVTLVCVAFGD